MSALDGPGVHPVTDSGTNLVAELSACGHRPRPVANTHVARSEPATPAAILAAGWVAAATPRPELSPERRATPTPRPPVRVSAVSAAVALLWAGLLAVGVVWGAVTVVPTGARPVFAVVSHTAAVPAVSTHDTAPPAVHTAILDPGSPAGARATAVLAAEPTAASSTVAPAAAGDDPGAGITLAQLLSNVRLALLGILGSLTIVFVSLGSLLLITARGETEQVEKGKNAIRSAAWGFLLTLGAPALVTLLMGLFTPHGGG